MKYNPITALQSAVGLDAPVQAIFAAAEQIEQSSGKRAACSPAALLHLLYTDDGEQQMTEPAAGKELGVSKQAINHRHTWILRRLRWILTHEEVNVVLEI